MKATQTFNNTFIQRGLRALAVASVAALAMQSAQAGVSDWWKKEQLRAEAQRAEADLPNCNNCATVTSVREEKRKSKNGTKGAVIGGVIGGLLGNQMGKGDGNTAATVIGAVGGAWIGHEMERKQNRTKVWKVTVRDRLGQERSFDYKDKPTWIEGQVVRVKSGNVLGNYPSDTSEVRVMMPADTYYGYDQDPFRDNRVYDEDDFFAHEDRI